MTQSEKGKMEFLKSRFACTTVTAAAAIWALLTQQIVYFRLLSFHSNYDGANACHRNALILWGWMAKSTLWIMSWQAKWVKMMSRVFCISDESVVQKPPALRRLQTVDILLRQAIKGSRNPVTSWPDGIDLLWFLWNSGKYIGKTNQLIYIFWTLQFIMTVWIYIYLKTSQP